MRRILIVDDEPRITEAFLEAFHNDYEVATASTGTEAIRIVKDAPPELIILDWRLCGEVDGRDVLGFVKREHPKIPVYVVTASIRFVKEIQSLGADDCLLKPCADLLQERIRLLLPPYNGKQTLDPT